MSATYQHKHTTVNNIEHNMTIAFVMEFWNYMSDKINGNNLFDEDDKNALFKDATFITQFLEENESYCYQKVIK